MKAFVDRIENGIAVLLLGEDESVVVNMPLYVLPSGVREGVWLNVDFKLDKEATNKAQEDIQSLMDSMPNKP